MKTILIITLLFCVGIFLCFTGCSGKISPNEDPLPDLPEWVDNPPQDDDEYLYVVESGASRDIGRARRKAMQNARAAIALKIEAEVTVLVKNFEEEVGGDPSTAEVTGLFAQISKSVADQTLTGTGDLKIHRLANPDGLSTTVYVLMEMHRGNVDASAVTLITKNDAAYNRWRAAESFKELEHAVKENRERAAQE